ncbi:MAG: winged helix-turn-helix transcriptional regulator [Thaumarchaeota archaeon]|nr:MAG: winged helix-turn-helix transcriptional regulator [Nitrososphaerota archaeon]
MEDKSSNSNLNKERILNFIQKNPGCYLRQIRNELALSMGSVQYHVSASKKRKDNLY